MIFRRKSFLEESIFRIFLGEIDFIKTLFQKKKKNKRKKK